METYIANNKLRLFATFITATFLCSLSSCIGTSNGRDSFDTLRLDSVVTDTIWPIDSTNTDLLMYISSDDCLRLSCFIEMPSHEQNELLADSFTYWVVSEIADWNGHEPYTQNNLRDYIIETTLHGGQDSIDIRRVYENANIVTFRYYYYCYGLGAAHSLESSKGVTFCKKDGKRLGWNIFKPNTNFQPILRSGLERYYNMPFDSVKSHLLYEMENVPMPREAPWIEKDGIHFIFSEYYISSYADGMPTFTLPIVCARETMNNDIYELIQ